MNKVALYFRLSVEEQSGREESESIISQRNYVTSFFKAQSDLKDFPYEEYIDDGFSGSNTKRPGFERMMNDVKANLVKTIIVKIYLVLCVITLRWVIILRTSSLSWGSIYCHQ